MLAAADLVEDFEGTDHTGARIRLSTLLEKGPVVLFFYPAAMTSGCTAESCHFRDLAAEFAEVGASRVGISADSVDKQAEFAGKHGFDYPLIADTDKSIAKIFGVTRIGGLLPSKRVTFVIDTDRRVLAVIKSEMKMDTHADEALAALRERVPS